MEFIKVLWDYILISSPYLLFGFLISGVVHQFLHLNKIQKLLKNNKKTDVLWAALLGVPLPLCSCSVIPTGATLKKAGASNGATSAFLISTPESGIDSIAMSLSILDLPMAIFRPVFAFVTATIAGTLQHIFNPFNEVIKEEKKDCCHSKDDDHGHSHSHDHAKDSDSFLAKTFKFGFVELLDDMANWLFVGLLLGALISYFIPESFFSDLNPHVGKLVILLVSIPLYICASASTPIAASLILKGLSPGAAIIFLLAGPATNISNIAVIQKYIGKKGVIINILTIIGVAYLASYIVDYFYTTYPLNINLATFHEHINGPFFTGCAIIFLGLLLMSLYRVNLKKV